MIDFIKKEKVEKVLKIDQKSQENFEAKRTFLFGIFYISLLFFTTAILVNQNLVNSSEDSVKRIIDSVRYYINKESRFTLNEAKICSEFKKKYNKSYQTEVDERSACRNILQEIKQIEENNRIVKLEGKGSLQKLWKYSDLTIEEKRKYLLGLDISQDEEYFDIFEPNSNVSIPNSVDFTKQMGSVRDQGRCGSCWAFSAAEMVDYVMKKRGVLQAYSTQQIVDCSPNSGGCSGDSPLKAIKYIKTNGITSEHNYPYVAHQQNCKYNSSQRMGEIKNYKGFNVNGDENKLKEIIGTNQAPVIAFICIEKDFLSYKNGVYNHPNCCTKVNHAILIVGYGTDPNEGDYWKIMNSWGKSWGVNGFGYIARNRGNMCNIALAAIYVE